MHLVICWDGRCLPVAIDGRRADGILLGLQPRRPLAYFFTPGPKDCLRWQLHMLAKAICLQPIVVRDYRWLGGVLLGPFHSNR